MNPTLSVPENCQPVFCSDVERLQNLVRKQQQQIEAQQQIIDRLEQQLKRQGESPLYVLIEYAYDYLKSYSLAAKHWEKLTFSAQALANDKTQWSAYLKDLGIVSKQASRLVTESALLGGTIEQGVDIHLKILSDGGPQFNILVHTLCWIHAERALRRLSGEIPQQHQNIEQMQQLLWDYYHQLKAYQQNPDTVVKRQLEQDFDQLHNNGSESDIREYVTLRKVSGGSRSETGRRVRDTFLGLKKTCRKLGISFWRFLISRLRGDGQIPPLPDLIRGMTSRL